MTLERRLLSMYFLIIWKKTGAKCSLLFLKLRTLMDYMEKFPKWSKRSFLETIKPSILASSCKLQVCVRTSIVSWKSQWQMIARKALNNLLPCFMKNLSSWLRIQSGTPSKSMNCQSKTTSISFLAKKLKPSTCYSPAKTKTYTWTTSSTTAKIISILKIGHGPITFLTPKIHQLTCLAINNSKFQVNHKSWNNAGRIVSSSWLSMLQTLNLWILVKMR